MSAFNEYKKLSHRSFYKNVYQQKKILQIPEVFDQQEEFSITRFICLKILKDSNNRNSECCVISIQSLPYAFKIVLKINFSEQ